MGGERNKRKGQGMECKQKKTPQKNKTKNNNNKKNKQKNPNKTPPVSSLPHTFQSLFLLQKCKFIYIYIFRSWNVVVTY